jgi:HEAT repeat protein
MFRNFRLDLISFVLGFAAATLFWWVAGRIRPLLPGLWAEIKKFIRTMRQRNLEGADEFLRKDTLRRAQKMHLTASMFALDEILLPPLLMAPPAQIDPDQQPPEEAIVTQTIPYLPDWPELAAGHGAASFTLAEALHGGSSIAVIGQPGSGKTVMLADFASRLARKDPSLGDLSQHIPLYLHILDLGLELPANGDPLPALFKAITPHVTMIYQNQLTRLVLDRLQENQAILILDGLDELHPTALQQASTYLKALLAKFPHLPFIAAASADFLDGLVGLGLSPLGMAAWGPAQRDDFVEKWSQGWAAHIAPEIAKQHKYTAVSPLLVDNWLRGERGFPTPLEWTIKVWGAYAGDLQPAPFAAMNTLLARFGAGVAGARALEALAQEFVLRETSALPYIHLDKLLTGLAPATPVFVEAPDTAQTEQPAEPIAQKAGAGKKAKGDMILSAGELILENLVKNGLLAEHQGSLIRFTHPAVLGFFAAQQDNPEYAAAALRTPFWTLANQSLRYLSAVSDDCTWIDRFLQCEQTPLFRPLLSAARWLPDGKQNASWRGPLFRQLLNGLQDERLPLSLRARMMTAFVFSNDPSTPKLLKQLIAARMPAVRTLAVLGTGAWGDPGLAAELTTALNDMEESVRNAACLGLVSLHTEAALSSVADVLLNGDERLRQAAAESLVYLPRQGHDIIREAAQVSDLLTRRAAVFGLLQVREPWSKQLLEKIAVEDGQWVVRNAAAQALESMQENDPRIPKPLLPPHQTPWLIAFAGKRNLGLSEYQAATNILILALKSGTVEDQIAALRFLKDTPEETVISAVYALLYGDQPELKDAAYLLAWQWALAGVKLPDPALFGVSLS